MENKDTFNYTYSAKKQEEIKAIRKKYTEQPKEEDKIAKLRRLDSGVTKKATIVSLIVGILGALILGFGMSLIMSDLSDIMGFQQNMAIIIGVIVGVIGIIPVSVAYPLYNSIVKTERKKIAPEIIRLTDELLK